jgi:DNA-binding CsgD family transcriptional regulator
MSTDTVASLFLEDIQNIRSVERQIKAVLTRIASGVSVQGLSEAALRILRTTEHHMARLERIFEEIEPAGADETVCCPAVAEHLRGELEPSASQDGETGSSFRAPLTQRQVEVLQLIAEGYANKQIAAKLAISIKTVEKHRQRMMAKLDLHDTAGVTRYAISAGVVEAVA